MKIKYVMMIALSVAAHMALAMNALKAKQDKIAAEQKKIADAWQSLAVKKISEQIEKISKSKRLKDNQNLLNAIPKNIAYLQRNQDQYHKSIVDILQNRFTEAVQKVNKAEEAMGPELKGWWNEEIPLHQTQSGATQRGIDVITSLLQAAYQRILTFIQKCENNIESIPSGEWSPEQKEAILTEIQERYNTMISEFTQIIPPAAAAQDSEYSALYQHSLSMLETIKNNWPELSLAEGLKEVQKQKKN